LAEHHYSDTAPERSLFVLSSTHDAPGTLDPSEVAQQTLAALGRGARVVPGTLNRVASFAMGRLLPRSVAVRIMAANTKDLT